MTDHTRHAPFWMICRKPRHPDSKTEPKQRYGSIADARRAARAIAKSTDAPMVILQSVETVDPGDDNQTGLLL